MASRKKTLTLIAAMLVAAVFITSAIFKLIGIDSFEVYIYSKEIFSLSVSTILARVIVSFELVLGVLWFLQWRFPLLKKITIGTLAVFSVYLLIQVIQGETENCQCFGTIIYLTPLESLIKNIILILIIYFGVKTEGYNFKHKSSVALFAVGVSSDICT